MKTNLVLLTIAMLVCAVTHAVPITLFSDADTYVKRAKDIVIAKCVSVPKQGSRGYEDGLHAVTVDVLMVLKGEKEKGRLTVGTIYAMKPGETYLLSSLGGSALGTDFLALPQLSVVPIPSDFDLAVLKGKNVKQQVHSVFARHLHQIEQQLAPLLEKQGLLRKALQDRVDDLYESKGDVRINDIRRVATRKKGSTIYLEFTSGKLQWSQSSPGKSGYLYFRGLSPENPKWEFAASDHADIKAFDGMPLKAKFYGEFSPSRDRRLGLSSSGAINVEVGQVVLARNVQEPTTIYILKIESHEQVEAMTVNYTVLGGR